MYTLALLITATAAQSQSVTCPEEVVCGRVVDSEQTGIEGVSIESDDGAASVSRSDGSFRIARPQRPDVLLIIDADGYQQLTLAVSDLTALDGVVQLAPDDDGGSDIVVTARRQSLPFTRQVIDQTALLTDPVANADALLAVAGLPSSTNLDNSADVQLRGGAIGLSRTYYNDIPLYEVVRGSSADQVTRVASVFNANLIRTIETYPTLPPTYLANSAAGAVRILPSVDADAPSSLYLGLPGFTLSQAGAISSNGAFQAYVSGIDLSASLALNPGLKATTTAFRSGAVGGAVEFTFDDGSEVNVLSVLDGERGRFPLRILNLDGPSVSRRSRAYAVASYEAPVNDLRLKLDGALTFTDNSLDYQGIKTTSHNRFIYANADVAGQALAGRLDYRGGLSLEHFRLASSGTLDFTSSFTTAGRRVASSSYTAAHVFVTFRPADHIALAVGTRQFIVGDLDLSAVYSAAATVDSSDGRHKLIIGLGTYSAAVPSELGSASAVGIAESRQVSADYELRIDGLSLRAGLYLKEDDIDGVVTHIEGADASVQVRLSPTSLVAASFARSRHRSKGFRGDRDLGYAVRLQARIGLAPGAAFNATYTLRSGASYTRVIDGQDDGGGGFFPLFDPVRNEQDLRPFRTLDLNIVAPLPIGRPGSQPIGFISITNVLDRRNEARAVYNSDFSVESRIFYDRRAISFGIVKQF
jgi:hypothetical protein